MRWGKLPILSPLYNVARSVIMARSGLQPFGEYSYSLDGHMFRDRPSLRIPLPNLSGALDSVIRQYIDCYGLGERCLLVSENNEVKSELARHYPLVRFATCDCYPELMARGKEAGATAVDVLWDVCQPAPARLRSEPFHSVLCHALLEHVIAPSMAMVNLFSVCRSGGVLYILTCTPSFFYHGFPRDYVRFHKDYFEDLPAFMERHDSTRCQLLALHSKEGLIRACYRKS
jgi:hypothetical protein